MRRIVHLGRGRTAETNSRDFVDPTVATPRTIPTARRQALQRIKPVYVAPTPEGPVRYVPGPLLAMREGQCRFSIRDGIFCGARTVAGKSWCSHHDDVVHGRLVTEAAE